MKNIMHYILILFLTVLFSQEDSVTFTGEEVKLFRNSIIECEKKDSLNTAIINNLEEKILLLNTQIDNDSLIFKEYEYQLKMKDEYIKLIKPKWYDNKYLWYIGGIFSIYMSSEVVSNIK